VSSVLCPRCLRYYTTPLLMFLSACFPRAAAGGTMPSIELMQMFQDDLSLQRQWCVGLPARLSCCCCHDEPLGPPAAVMPGHLARLLPS
jgi:hypothetical protein